MKYLIHKTRKSPKVHLWNESANDTYCAMHSTGGINKDAYKSVNQKPNFDTCKMCQDAKSKGKKIKPKLKERKALNASNLESDKNKVARFCGIGGKYSALELVIAASVKLNYTVRGDIHPHGQIKHICKLIDNAEKPVRNKCHTMKSFYSSRAWKVLRYQAFEKYGNRCQCCGARPSDDVALHVDHVKPRSKHPELALDLNNLQILCEWCNIGKINQYDTKWQA